MLRNTFRHLPGIGPVREAGLWRSGVTTWDDLEHAGGAQFTLFSGRRDSDLISALDDSRRALQGGDVRFFASRLPPTEHYRIALTFPQLTVFTDIESTGLSLHYDALTLVGWQKNGAYEVLIRGQPAHELKEVFRDAGIIVTFNGARFDVPFLRRDFPDIEIPPVHVDLRFLARRVGLRGGQKAIEEALGISRPQSLEGIQGEAAPVLWHRYRWGDRNALRTLVEYNYADVRGMVAIFHACIKFLAADVPFLASTAYTFPAGQSHPRFASKPGRKGIWLPPPPATSPTSATLDSLGLQRGIRLIGIDLTGSEKRPSGWAVIDGHSVSTRRISSDDEIVEATLATRPTAVSIDSPLSLPTGRHRVEDDDPTRAIAGITRACERELRRRGVNVYPCLLPSMQQLTARGIRLAKRFRRLGVPVIESYPGAAQDILGIPRKRASLELLAKGLARFGIEPEQPLEDVSHDELDAVTSAIVGAFFWAGRFEALGIEEENRLIIPDVTAPEPRWRGDHVVGLSGPIAAGKTTAGQYLMGRGFAYTRYSQVIEQLAISAGVPPTRVGLQELGRRIHEDRGQEWLGQRVLETLPAAGNRVIDGLRHPEDHAFLAETLGPQFVHIHIDAPLAVRRERYLWRNLSEEDFQNAIEHPAEANVHHLALLAHVRISNSGPMTQFLETVAIATATNTLTSTSEAECR